MIIINWNYSPDSIFYIFQLHNLIFLFLTPSAEPLAQVLGLPIATTPLLREIHVGELAGLTRAEAEARFPSFLAEAAKDPWNARRPGGESMADLARRLQAFLEEVPPGRHLVVTHGGVIRAAP